MERDEQEARQMANLSDNSPMDIISRVHNLLYKYTYAKLQTLCEEPAMATIFKTYMNKNDSSEDEYNEVEQEIVRMSMTAAH